MRTKKYLPKNLRYWDAFSFAFYSQPNALKFYMNGFLNFRPQKMLGLLKSKILTLNQKLTMERSKKFGSKKSKSCSHRFNNLIVGVLAKFEVYVSKVREIVFP